MIRNVVLLCGIIVCLCAGTAQAQLFLEEGKVNLAVSGGDRVNKTLTVHNTTGQDVDVKVYWEDFAYEPPYESAKVFSPAGTRPDSLSGWISFSPTSFKLPAHGRVNVSYTINVPDVINEGHYGVLFFEQSLGNMKTPEGINIITRVGCLFFVEPKGVVKKAELRNFKITGGKLAGDFVNVGKTILTPKTTYYVMDKGGVAVDRGKVKNLYVPPGASAPFDVTLPKKLDAGVYTLVINSDLEEGDVSVKEIELSKDASDQLTIQQVGD